MNVKFTCESTESVAIREIKKQVARFFSGDISLDISVTEGAEKCGYGKLLVSGTVTVDRDCLNGGDFIRTVYSICETSESQWRNYGRPSGTRYDLSAELKFAKEEKKTYSK
jgi:hypothetical protein